MSLHRRLERLEATTGNARYEWPLWLKLFMKEMDNIQREGRGEEPVPLTPEEAQLKREQQRAFLEHYVPKVREGEMRPEILDIVDNLEEHVTERLLEGDRDQ
jgi:hypothetical protein